MKNQLPKDWKWVKLGEACYFIGGGTPSKKESSYWNGNIFWASVKDIKGDYLNSTEDTITETGLNNSASNIAEPNDVILITRISPGKTIITNVRTAINQDLKIVKPKFKTTSKFISYYFKSIERKLINHSSGTTVLGITLNNLNEITIPLLDTETQNTIVSKIEELFSEIEKGIESLFTARQQLKTYRQSVLKWAFEGKLTNGLNYEKSLNYDLCDLPDVHDLSIAADPETEYKVDNNHNNQKNQKNHSSDKGELPKGWKWVRIGQICKCIVPNRDKPKSFTGNIKWITTPNLCENSIRLDYENVRLGLSESETKEYNARVIPINSVIMTCVGTFGLSAIVEKPIVINQQLHAFITNEDVNPKYLAYCIQFNKYYFESKSTSTTIQYLNKANCNSMPFPLCSVEEQISIVQEIESRLSVADKMEESIAQSLQQAEALKQSILKKAFEGKLV